MRLRKGNPMRVLFSSMRLAGHIRPLLPYLGALQRRGHEVLVAAPKDLSGMLQAEGFQHAPFDRPDEELLEPVWARARALHGEEKTAFFVSKVFADKYARAALPKLRETIAGWQPDLIVRESCEYGAAVAAAEAGIPNARVAVGIAGIEELGLTHAAGPIDVLRREAGLNPDNGAALRAAPVFTSFPASLDGGASEAGGPAPFRARAPRDMVDQQAAVPDWALTGGLPLVYITFGTIAAGMEAQHVVFRAALEAVAGLPVRVLLSTGAAMEAGALGTIPPNVTVCEWVGQSEVFPRAAALMCHGGSGSVLAGLASGLPMVIAPLFADQPRNARAVEAAGAGVAVFDHNPASLRAALERVLADAGLRDGARRIAAEMAAMPDMDAAVDALLAPLAVARP
jgi:UDP:flavonoid glycosyltransferase YjiC (YdhE family)